MMNNFANLFSVFDSGSVSAPYAQPPSSVPGWDPSAISFFPDEFREQQQQQLPPLLHGCSAPAPNAFISSPAFNYSSCDPQELTMGYTNSSYLNPSSGGVVPAPEISGVSGFTGTSNSWQTLPGELAGDTGCSKSDDCEEAGEEEELLGESWYITLKSAGVRIKGRSRKELRQVAEKIRKRRRESAARSRARKATKLSTLQDENEALREENEELRRRLEELTACRGAAAQFCGGL